MAGIKGIERREKSAPQVENDDISNLENKKSLNGNMVK
jgi:hypothetical protein